MSFDSCQFNENQSVIGGALSVHVSSVSFKNSTFTNNSAETGGALYIKEATDVSFVNCAFDSNTAHYEGSGSIANGAGGAVFLEDSHYSEYINCVFYKNQVSAYGGALFSVFERSSKIVNSLFLQNSASVGGSIYAFGSDLQSANSIFWENSSSSTENRHGIDFEGFDQNSANHINLIQDKLPVLGKIISTEPEFVNSEKPKGPDGIWFTDDDGLRSRSDSITIDNGNKDSLQKDRYDIDSDGKTLEEMPIDAIGKMRTFSVNTDLGPYEYDPTSLILNIRVQNTNKGNVIGSGKVAVGQKVQLTAEPKHGYVFESWGEFSMDKSNSITLVILEDIVLNPKFHEKVYYLNYDSTKGGKIEILGNEKQVSPIPFLYLSDVEAKALPTVGYKFDKWLGHLTGNQNPISFSVTDNHNISAKFTKIKHLIIDKTISGGSILGVGSYEYGNQITLIASPEPGYQFEEWDDDAKLDAGFLTQESFQFFSNRVSKGESEPSSISLNVFSDLNVSAKFTKIIVKEIDEHAEHLGHGWKKANWFGTFYPTKNGWLYHLELGWVYSEMRTSSSTWFWIEDFGWCWTKQDIFPFIYNHNRWLYFKRNSYPKKFFDYKTKLWIDGK